MVGMRRSGKCGEGKNWAEFSTGAAGLARLGQSRAGQSLLTGVTIGRVPSEIQKVCEYRTKPDISGHLSVEREGILSWIVRLLSAFVRGMSWFCPVLSAIGSGELGECFVGLRLWYGEGAGVGKGRVSGFQQMPLLTKRNLGSLLTQ